MSQTPPNTPLLPMTKHRVGDRVCRRVNVFDDSSPLRRGTVIAVYADRSARFGPYDELYEVEWDGGARQRGYLPHGLSPVTDDDDPDWYCTACGTVTCAADRRCVSCNRPRVELP